MKSLIFIASTLLTTSLMADCQLSTDAVESYLDDYQVSNCTHVDSVWTEGYDFDFIQDFTCTRGEKREQYSFYVSEVKNEKEKSVECRIEEFRILEELKN